MHYSRRFPIHSIFTLSLALLVACASEGDSTSSVSSFREEGPWVAGVTTLSLGDRSVEVWYPANPAEAEGLERDAYFIRDFVSPIFDAVLDESINPPFVTDAYRDVAAAQDGPFPLLIFAHGAASYRLQSTFLTSHLATWGFVVASVDYLERGLGVASFGPEPEIPIEDDALTGMVVDLLEAENATDGGLLEGRVSTDQIGITGHSAGGGTSIRFADDPRVIAYAPLSAGIFDPENTSLPEKPSLWLTGDIDDVVELEDVELAFGEASTPTRLVVIRDMGHLGPSEICAIGAEGGGVIQLALDGGIDLPENLIRLGTDGCQEEAVSPADGWVPVQHFVTAFFRNAFEMDRDPIGLDQDVQAEIPEAGFTYEEAL
jgi:dienelactone hydrolase